MMPAPVSSPAFFTFSLWDIVLLVVVTTMGTFLAYIRDARWKAFLLGLPFPFTIANLSLGLPIGPSHALGMAVLLLFMNLVRWLHTRARLHILASIAISEAAYLLIAALLNRFVPQTPFVFWCCMAVLVPAGALLLVFLPRRQEPAYRSPLPVAAKIAAIAAVIAVIVVLKNALGGFMAMFPMVSTIAVYEGRHSLWTMGRQIPVFMVTAGPLMAAMALTQQLLGWSVPLSLLAGWAVFLAVMIPVTLVQMRRGGPPDLQVPAVT
jgi:hypothetical protein